MLNFIELTVEQIEPENNLPEAISALLGQALISNPVKYMQHITSKPTAFLLNKCQGVTVICST